MSHEVPLLDRLMHDLKGPLAPLQTAVYLLAHDDLPPERRQELLATVDRQTRRLGVMIDEAGDWFRASQQRLIGRHEPIELALLLDTAIGGVVGCNVEPEIPSDLAACIVHGDETRLVQLLVTLLRHASARDPRHTPRLVVASLPGALRITISDRGPPLDPVALAGLLEHPHPEPTDAGLGLRLLIAAAIARAHGGTLQALPGEAGQGLLLVCELPLG